MASLHELRIADDDLSLFDLPNEVCLPTVSTFRALTTQDFYPCAGFTPHTSAASDQIGVPPLPKPDHSYHTRAAVARSFTC